MITVRIPPRGQQMLNRQYLPLILNIWEPSALSMMFGPATAPALVMMTWLTPPGLIPVTSAVNSVRRMSPPLLTRYTRPSSSKTNEPSCNAGEKEFTVHGPFSMSLVRQTYVLPVVLEDMVT